jgi:hypothetical protein
MSTKPKRVVLSRICAVLFAILLPLTTISAWAITTVSNTDRWVSAMHPLATNPVITNYIGQQVTEEIIQQTNVQARIESALPAQASFLAGTITNEIQKTIEKAIDQALASPQFATFWDRANRLTHTAAIAVISGKYNSQIQKAHDLVLNLPVDTIINAINTLTSHGITFLAPLKSHIIGNRLLVLNILSAKELSKVQSYYNLATTLRWVLIVLTLLLGALTIALARPVRAGVRRFGIALTVAAALSYCLLRIGIRLAAPLAPTPEDVATAVLKTVTSFLNDELFIMTLVGVAILVVVWFTGQGSRAVATRAWISSNSKAIWAALTKKTSELRGGEMSEWSMAHRTQLRRGLGVAHVVIYALLIIALFAWIDTFLGFVLMVAIGVGWYFLHRRLASYLDVAESALPPATGNAVEPTPELSSVSAASESEAPSSDESDATAPE